MGGLFECDEDYFGIRAQAHRRAPGAGAARRVNHQIAEPLQAVDEWPVDARCDPRKRKILPAVRVPRKLQADLFFRRDGQMMRRVRQKNARDIRIDFGVAQDGAVMLWLHRVMMMDADELQAIDHNLFVVEHAHARVLHGIEIFRVVAKLLVISGNEIRPERRRNLMPRRGEL